MWECEVDPRSTPPRRVGNTGQGTSGGPKPLSLHWGSLPLSRENQAAYCQAQVPGKDARCALLWENIFLLSPGLLGGGCGVCSCLTPLCPSWGPCHLLPSSPAPTPSARAGVDLKCVFLQFCMRQCVCAVVCLLIANPLCALGKGDWRGAGLGLTPLVLDFGV